MAEEEEEGSKEEAALIYVFFDASTTFILRPEVQQRAPGRPRERQAKQTPMEQLIAQPLHLELFCFYYVR